MDLNQWFEKGMTVKQYADSMESHKENLKHVYETFTLPESIKDRLSHLPTEDLRAIVITEDWCGDAMVNVPVLMKIAEESGIELSMILRDSNLELMDQYLTNGTSRAIPIFVFIDKEGHEEAVWGPRAEELQQLVDEKRASLPDEEAEDFKEQKGQMIKELTEIYTTDSSAWEMIANSIVTRLASSL